MASRRGEKRKEREPEPQPKVVQIIKSSRGNDHLLTEDNHRYRVCKEYDNPLALPKKNLKVKYLIHSLGILKKPTLEKLLEERRPEKSQDFHSTFGTAMIGSKD